MVRNANDVMPTAAECIQLLACHLPSQLGLLKAEGDASPIGKQPPLSPLSSSPTALRVHTPEGQLLCQLLWNDLGVDKTLLITMSCHPEHPGHELRVVQARSRCVLKLRESKGDGVLLRGPYCSRELPINHLVGVESQKPPELTSWKP